MKPRRYAPRAFLSFVLPLGMVFPPVMAHPNVENLPTTSPQVQDGAVPTGPEAPLLEAGRLDMLAAVIGDDLTPKPLPKFRFLIRKPPLAEAIAPVPDETSAIASVATGFDGRATVALPPGRYHLVSENPLPWQGASFSWDIPFEIIAGATTTLEISNDNALRAPEKARRISDEAALFQKVRGAVFFVETETGHGSGFLVDASGLVITNHHVVGKSTYLAVKVTQDRKYPSRLLAADGTNDVAVLRIHPDAVAGVAPLALVTSVSGSLPVIEGEKVLAIGNPLSQEWTLTSGIVSKVEEEAIISDVNINPGNSGGPLLNMDGAVVGINTFGEGATFGPGVSGIVRIELAHKALAEARVAAAAKAPPPLDLLPVASSTPYPAEALRQLVTSKPDTKGYHVEMGKIDVQFLTPPLLHSLSKQDELRAAEQQQKRRKQKDAAGAENPKDDFYGWKRYAGLYHPVVIIQAVPEIEMTGGSIAGMILGSLAGVVTPARYKFKTDFRRMTLTRDGQEVRPITPGRVCETISAAALEDVSCYGAYVYPPEAFGPGAVMELLVFNEDEPDKPKRSKLPPALVTRLWFEFEPYRKALLLSEAATTK